MQSINTQSKQQHAFASEIARRGRNWSVGKSGELSYSMNKNAQVTLRWI
jgi:hypothetical protein